MYYSSKVNNLSCFWGFEKTFSVVDLRLFVGGGVLQFLVILFDSSRTGARRAEHVVAGNAIHRQQSQVTTERMPPPPPRHTALLRFVVTRLLGSNGYQATTPRSSSCRLGECQ